MDEERKRSKKSFFNFFDWNGKSRKKLFFKNPDLPEGSKQAEENVETTAKSQSHAIELDERRENSSNKGSSDFSCSSSVTSDDGYGTKAPGVVARLMGLDSLPTSSVAEPSSTPFFNSFSLRESQYDRSTPNLRSEYNSIEYLNISSNQEGFSWNSLESRSPKVQTRPIERFQTEMLPPKSAKSIPITHHKLLSPIKSPGFVPRKNPAYIIEAAAKIIETSPKATMNSKVPSIGSSSIPLRIRDLKQKMEAAHTASRPQISNESFAAKNRKGQLSDKSQSKSESIGKASIFSEKGTSDSLMNRGKSVSLAVQVKSNVQRKEGAISRSINTNTTKQKEINYNQSLKSPPGIQKTRRTSESRTNNTLRQNNQKQNCQSGKENSTLKSSVSNQTCRKAQSISGSVVQSRTVHKVALKSETMSKRMHSVVMDSEKEKPNGMSLKKRPVNGDLQISRSVSDNTSFNRDNRSIKCNIAVEGCMNKPVDNRKDGMDVVSFTFTSPVKKATPNHQPSEVGKSNSSATDCFVSNNQPYFNKSASSFPGLNIIGGDALGVLLEEKLRELTNKVESSQCNVIRDDNSASSISSLQNFVSTFNTVNAIPAAQRSQLVIGKDKSSHLDDFDCFSAEDSTLTDDRKWQGSTEMEEDSSSSNFSKAEKDRYRHPSPVSILEPSFESGSCSNTNVQADEVLNGFSASESIEVEGESELSDSATSISTVNIGRKRSTTTESKDLSDWELDYVRDILDNAETMLKDFGSGKTSKVITLNLFLQLENQESGMKGNEEDYSKLWQKVLFDCVSECLDQMSRHTFFGSCRSWVKLQTMFQRKEWLAEELYKEILGWKSMGDLMVDELVDKDMSTQYGKWIKFNIEIFEEGVEIEKEILTSLVDELVSDLFIL